MDWTIIIYIILGILFFVALTILILFFIKSGMKDYLIELIAEAENLFPKDLPDYQSKRLAYVLESFKSKYRWISWVINATKFIAKICASFKIIKK